MYDENSTYTPQHLFYIGDDINENIRNTYSDSLIFDRQRNSIFAQNHEFGYICDYENSISVRNSDGTNSTVLTLSVVNGQIVFKEYRSVLITTYAPKYIVDAGISYSGTTYALGANVTLNYIDIRTSGSEVSNLLEINNIFNGKTENNEILTNSEAGFVENFTQRIQLPNNENTNYKSETAGTFNIVDIRISDPKGAFDEKKLSISWQNNVMLYKWSKDSMDFFGLRDLIITKSSLSGVIAELGNTTLYNALTGNYRIGGSTVTCTNGPNEYLGLCCPSRLQNADMFTGILGGAAVQEFKKIRTVTYINSANYIENYNIYLATGHNWNGQSLVLK